MPMCEIERKNRKEKVLDYLLGSRAISEGKALIGLESVKEQIGAMASLTLEFHLKSLEETVKLGDKIDDMMETMVQLYVAGQKVLDHSRANDIRAYAVYDPNIHDKIQSKPILLITSVTSGCAKPTKHPTTCSPLDSFSLSRFFKVNQFDTYPWG